MKSRVFERVQLLRAMVWALAVLALPASDAVAQVDPSLLSGLRWRSIGPAFFSGRVTDIAGVAGDPNTIYFAHASAGLFKTVNGGVTWESIFDDGNTLSIGAIALAPDDPNVIYAGTGEGYVRNSVSYGDGVYKSSDGGKTWKNLGLRDSERIARVVVNPKDSRVVFVAAMGHHWGPNEERGVYRSTDGGETWRRVLYVNNTTGAGDLAIDPDDPNILYAGMYDYLRQPWHFRSGGPGSGLYRSPDGGETWTKLTDPALDNGLPGAQPIGRIGVAVSPSEPAVVYAVIEATEPGVLWRSSDRGLHWELVHSSPAINARPFYFSRLTVDPADPNRVYSVSRSLYISNDGGRSFDPVSYGSMFGDNHVTWIDPLNERRILAGSDGGLYRSNDRGAHWEPMHNLPLAQAYHMSLDMEDPYNVLGGFQDHEMWRGPNERWNQAGVRGGDWRRMRNHGDGMYVVADPHDSNIVYYTGELGDLTRFDVKRQEERYIMPYPVGSVGYGANLQQYRFNWDAPIVLSPTNPGVVYFGGNVVFKTSDEGQSWQVISPDLTTNDRAKMMLSGGPVNPDNTHAEYYSTITSIAESPRNPELIWAGTDDGNVQVTRDGGANWINVSNNIAGAPSAAMVAMIRPSFQGEGTAFLAIDQHALDDFRPYAFMTTDHGETWRNISAGLNGYVHVVMDDPRAPNLLYAGTELGVFVSFDRGNHWTDLRLGLPRLPVTDMQVHPRDNDLVIATHARGFYVMDDVTPLQELARAMSRPVTLFKPMRTTRYIPVSDVSSLGDREWVAPNDPYGAEISYFLASETDEPVELTILDGMGVPLRAIRGSGNAGVNRVVWNLTRVGCPGDAPGGSRRGRSGVSPRVLPGQYTVLLHALGETAEQTVEVRPDPRFEVSDEDWAALELQVTLITSMQCAVDGSLRQIASVERQLSEVEQRLPENFRAAADRLRTELHAVRVELSPDSREPEHLNLNKKIDDLSDQIQLYSGRPTDAQVEWAGTFDEQLAPLLQRLRQAFEMGLARVNEGLRSMNLEPIVP